MATGLYGNERGVASQRTSSCSMEKGRGLGRGGGVASLDVELWGVAWGRGL